MYHHILHYLDNFQEDARAVTEIAEETKRNKQKRHHSVQEPPSTHLSSIDYSDNPHVKLLLDMNPFSKSPSTSFTKVMKSERSGMNFVNTKEDISDKRFPKWCGLLSSFSSAGNSRQSSKKPPKRRMSTFI
ncbi:unnamed protein product [Brugia pahangi]|uniref:Ovule protein n=1 Tax=Brugia pahangi TaxID=6280 RepID=A0A0N4TQE5_BRUPA|nr:unnamed protein product [Brugia pahangi]